MILCVGPTPAAQRVMIFKKIVAGSVNRALSTTDGASGKAVNVGKVLKILGEEPLVIGFVGGGRGLALTRMLDELQVRHEFVTVTPETRLCTTLLDESEKTQTELVEESRPLADSDYDTLKEIVRSKIKGCRAIVMSGTLTPNASPDFYAECTRMAKSNGAICIVDAKGSALLRTLELEPEVVKPNREELTVTVETSLTDESSVLRAMRELIARGARSVVVTAGEEATLACDKDKSWRIHAPKLEVVNAIGSGDAFTAALTWRLLKGEPLGESCRWAVAGGVANALSLMPGELRRADVDSLVARIKVQQLP